jgi:DNA-binding GntR family transcriptional regulator
MRRVQTIPEQIVDQLRKDILAGILQEGTPLREQELSERFGVSRGPVRAALQQLAAEGLVVAVPNVGVRVAPYPREEVFPVIIQMRQLIEECILSLICEQLSADLIHHLEEVLEKLRTACDQADMPAVQALDRAFHSTLVESYGEQRLVTIWKPSA